MILFIGCSSGRKLQTPIYAVSQKKINVDEAIHQVSTYHRYQGKHEEAVEILKALTRGDYVYYRADEILYWIALFRKWQDDPVRANRALETLKRYYPWASDNFDQLTQLEDDILELQEEQADQQVNETPISVIPEEDFDQPTVSNSFYDTDLRTALSDISLETGVKILIDPLVQGYITGDYESTPLERVLSDILIPNGYSFRKFDDYYLVADASPLSPAFRKLAVTKKIELKYLKTDQLRQVLPDHYNEYVQFDISSNAIVISAPPEIIVSFEEDLCKLDILPTQFLIEVEVVELTEEAQRIFGINWDLTGTKDNASFILSNLAPLDFTDAPENIASLLGEMIQLGEQGPNGFTIDRRTALHALSRCGLVNVIATPRLTTHQGMNAQIRVGKEAYFNLLQGGGTYVTSQALEKIATGVILGITPYKGGESQITTELSVEVSDVIESGGDGLPVTSVRSVQTRATVANGHSFSIGGLLLENKRKSVTGIPFLSEIPFIGSLFGQTYYDKTDTEVVIMITPHVLLDPSVFKDL
ncbi:type II and III secretion system protein [bacterium]|nr:type II and III secretion system protein [bacterium]